MTRLSLWFRNLVTDRANAPVRRQLARLIPDGARVLEIGCANGRLLLDVAPRIAAGVGIDQEETFVAYATRTAKHRGHHHLQFVRGDARQVLDHLPIEPSVAVASLFLHALPPDEAIGVLRALSTAAGRVIVGDISLPEAWRHRIFLHVDEWLAGHHDRYVAYRNFGGMPALLAAAGLQPIDEQLTPNPTVRIWLWERGGADALATAEEADRH